jgi:hypothetical protein
VHKFAFRAGPELALPRLDDPMTYPAVEAESVAAAEPARTANGPFGAFRWQIFLSIFMQRIGLNQTIGGVLYTPLVLGWLIWQGWARPSPTRIILYCLLLMGGCCSMLFAKVPGSAMSMYMYMALYALFLFPVVLEDDAYERFYRMVLKVCVIVCLIGVAQYMIQYVWHPRWLFTWRHEFDPKYLIEFNTLNWTSWGSGIYKANGFFLMEASWLSQLAARTLLIAVIMLRDPRYLIPCGAAMLATYSGTGPTLFLIFGAIPLMLLYLRNPRLLPWGVAALVAIPVLMFVFADRLNLELFTRRLEEFNTPNSSAYFRFVLGQQIFERFLNEPFITLIFGSGPGTADLYLAGYVNDGFIPGWLKLTVDYGFFGFMAFSAFLVTCVYQTTQSRIIAAAALFQYLWLDSSLVVPQAAFITLLMLAGVVRQSTFKPFGMASR